MGWFTAHGREEWDWGGLRVVPVVTAVEISPKAFLAAVHAWPVKVTCG